MQTEDDVASERGDDQRTDATSDVVELSDEQIEACSLVHADARRVFGKVTQAVRLHQPDRNAVEENDVVVGLRRGGAQRSIPGLDGGKGRRRAPDAGNPAGV